MKINNNLQISVKKFLSDTHSVSEVIYFNVQPIFVKYLNGDVSSAYVLSYIINSFTRFNTICFYHTNNQISDALGISLDVVKRAKSKIKNLPFIEIYTENYPRKTYYRLKPKEYIKFLIDIGMYEETVAEIFETFLARNIRCEDKQFFYELQNLIIEIKQYIASNLNLKLLLNQIKEVNMKLINNEPNDVSNNLDNSTSYPHSDVENSIEDTKKVSNKVDKPKKSRRDKSSVGGKVTNKIKKECLNNNLLLYDNIYNNNNIYIEKVEKKEKEEREGVFDGFSIHSENEKEFITAHYLRVFGKIPTFFEVKFCEDLIKEFGRENLVIAMEQSKLQNKSALAYVKAVLESMRDNKSKPDKSNKKKDPYASILEKIEKGELKEAKNKLMR